MKYTFYAIIQKSTEKVYIGCTLRKLAPRMAEHRYKAKIGRNEPLAKAIRECGWEDFEVKTIKSINCCKRDAILLEAELIQHYDSLNPEYGFNSQNGGNGYCIRKPLEIEGIKYLSITEASKNTGESQYLIAKKHFNYQHTKYRVSKTK